MMEDEFADGLEWLRAEMEAFYRDVPELDVASTVEPHEVRGHLRERYDFEDSTPLIDVLDDVRSMLRRWSVHVTHPRCFGYFNPSVTPPSVLGDSLAALYNPQLAVWSHAPAAVEMEQHVLRLFLRRFGMDESTSLANFATGGAEANLSALIVALTSRYPAFGDDGISATGCASDDLHLGEWARKLREGRARDGSRASSRPVRPHGLGSAHPHLRARGECSGVTESGASLRSWSSARRGRRPPG